MCGLDVYKASRRAFATGRHGLRRTAPPRIDGCREGHFEVFVRAVRVRDVVLRVPVSVCSVSTSYVTIWNGWYHGTRPTGSRARSYCCISSGGKG